MQPAVDWLSLSLPLLAGLLVVAAVLRRRLELRRHGESLTARAAARERGSHQARLQHPRIDLAACIGCGACVRACPEDGVLALAFGQAVVVHGARCVGHGRCAEACPTGAIALTLGDLSDRRDLPAIDATNEAVGVPGLFLAGEITGFALVRTAVAHGAQVARAVAARRVAAHGERGGERGDALDLLVIGLGPAGLSCLLAAKTHGLEALGVDQAHTIGGTVAAYPRRKLVMTQPMELPGHGRLGRLEYSREELVELWQGLAREHELPVQTGVVVQRIQREAGGGFVVVADKGTWRARHVCIAVGRRGTPQRLGVPGEDLAKVGYALLDAESYRDRRILVVGGGDSAIEAALALAEQPGNTVTVSYRRAAFARLKARNEARIDRAVQDGLVQVLLGSTVEAITESAVQLRVAGNDAGNGGTGGGVATSTLELANDDVFVFAGGVPPLPLLAAAGVSFDPALRPPQAAVERGTGLQAALAVAGIGLAALGAVRLVYADYYTLPLAQRTGSHWHELLRPQGPVGLVAGVLAVLQFATNLCYLLRRRPVGRWLPGSLRAWMNVHVLSGLAAVLLAGLHSGFTVRDSSGGHALLAMLVVVAAGAVGRWLYAFVPRAQNGRQQELEELGGQVAAIAGEWDRNGRGFGSDVRQEVERLVADARLGDGFVARVRGLLRSQWQLVRALRRVRRAAAAAGVPATEVTRLVALARRSHRVALQLVHFDEVRGLLATWRWLHRWLALLLLLLLAVHVATALRFGGVLGGAR
jgi:dihydropyrimidine dehydrogenase (NAD+) subunit PreT